MLCWVASTELQAKTTTPFLNRSPFFNRMREGLTNLVLFWNLGVLSIEHPLWVFGFVVILIAVLHKDAIEIIQSFRTKIMGLGDTLVASLLFGSTSVPILATIIQLVGYCTGYNPFGDEWNRLFLQMFLGIYSMGFAYAELFPRLLQLTDTHFNLFFNLRKEENMRYWNYFILFWLCVQIFLFVEMWIEDRSEAYVSKWHTERILQRMDWGNHQCLLQPRLHGTTLRYWETKLKNGIVE